MPVKVSGRFWNAATRCTGASREGTVVTSQTDVDAEQIVAHARALAREKVADRALELANTHDYPHDLFDLFREAGMFALYPDPQWGGLGLPLTTVCAVVEELAQVSATAASMVIGQLQGSLPILAAANDVVRRRYLPGLVEGSLKPAMALTEPSAGSDVAAITTLAQRDGDEFVLNGRKSFITMASLADVIVIYAKLERGRSTDTIQGFAVPRDTPGLVLGRVEDKMATPALPTSELLLEDCRVSGHTQLGEPGTGFRSAMHVLERVRPLIGARAVGLAAGALEVAVDHLRSREAFGGALADLQGLQFMVADMATQIEAARALVARACRAIDTEEPLASRYCAMAKYYATDMAMSVTADAVQLLGGYGCMRDFPVEHRLREAKLGQVVDGTNQVQRLIVARSVLEAGRDR